MSGIQPALEFDPRRRLSDDEYIIFDKFPMPPSSNEIYKHFTNPKTKKVVRVSSNALKDYKKQCDQWALVNHRLCKLANMYLRDEMYIQVDVWVAMHIERIHTGRGEVKKLDVSNRGKALFDCLSAAIGVDDRHFKRTRLDKIVASEFEPECCIIRMSRCELVNTLKVRDWLSSLKSPEAIVSIPTF